MKDRKEGGEAVIEEEGWQYHVRQHGLLVKTGYTGQTSSLIVTKRFVTICETVIIIYTMVYR